MERGGRNREGWRVVIRFRKDEERRYDSGRMERGDNIQEGWREVVGFRKDEERW